MGIPRTIGDIRVFAELGQGPISVVCKGYQRALDRFVLLKILRTEVARDEAIVERLEDEARLAARIQHENVVSVYSFGRENGVAYIATEYVEGMDLNELISKRSLPVELAVFILKEIARGLQAAHAQRVLHRDLKPSNVMISFSGQVKLTDFGFASLIDETSDEIRGTAPYLAPEQIRGEAFTSAGDLFALGALFYEMLVGRAAFLGKSTNDILDAVLNRNPGETLYALSDIPPAVAALCNQLLAKMPEERLLSAAHVVEELDSLAGTPADAKMLEQYLVAPHEYVHKIETDSRILDDSVTPSSAMAVDSVIATSRSRLFVWPFGAIAVATVIVAMLLIAGIWRTNDNADVGNPVFQLEEGQEDSLEDNRTVLPTAGNDAETIAIRNDADLNLTSNQRSVDNPDSLNRDASQSPTNTDGATEIESTRQDSTGQTDFSSPVNPDADVPGMLQVDSVPWAVLLIDGDSVATTPLRARIPVSTGEHTLILRNPNFPDYTTRIFVTSGQAVDLNVSLFAFVGQIYFEISPWAEVAINDVVRDTIPPQVQPLLLTAGEYTLRLRHPSLGTWQTSLLVEAGQTQRLRFNLFELLDQ